MKNLLLVVLIISLFGYISCNNDDPEPTALAVTVDDIVGEWTIVSFIDEGEQIADEFGDSNEIEIFANGDIFFPESGSFGSWDLEEDGKKLVIIIDSGGDPFDDFEEEWAIINFDENNLWLRDYDDFEDDDDGDDDDDIEEVRLQKSS